MFGVVVVKTVALVPYCPWPADTGGKSEMMKHLEILRACGPCRIVSAARRPVGGGWIAAARRELERRGFEIMLREERGRRWTAAQAWGMAYGAVCKVLRLERAFGHANPYHRFAFPQAWWRAVSDGFDLAVVFYSYWAWLPFTGPKALVLLDLWSNLMWGGTRRETREIAACDRVFVIALEEQRALEARGVDPRRLVWSPPALTEQHFSLPPSCALIGSANRFNCEGLAWLESAGAALDGLPIRVYGGLAACARHPGLERAGAYGDRWEPYRDHGIALLITASGTGLQIKSIEALAAGRAIVARRGAVRGLPPAEGAWIEVETPREAAAHIRRLCGNAAERARWAERARAYYRRHLAAERIRKVTQTAYTDLFQALENPSP